VLTAVAYAAPRLEARAARQQRRPLWRVFFGGERLRRRSTGDGLDWSSARGLAVIEESSHGGGPRRPVEIGRPNDPSGSKS
jgi:hypothetical protein